MSSSKGQFLTSVLKVFGVFRYQSNQTVCSYDLGQQFLFLMFHLSLVQVQCAPGKPFIQTLKDLGQLHEFPLNRM